MGSRIVYVCGARNFRSGSLGRKIGGVVACWNRLGHRVDHLCGGDVGEQGAGNTNYGSPDVHEKWYRRWGLLAPIIHSISERRDIKHDALLLEKLRDRAATLKPDLIWERSCRLHCAGLQVALENRLPYVLEWKDHLVDYQFSLFRGRALRMEDRKNREADYIVVESGALRDELGRVGVDTNKIIIAHNAVKADEFAPEAQNRAQVRKGLGVDDGTVLVGYLGSYAFYHDTARLVLAANIIRRRGAVVKMKILMVGNGKEYQDTRKLAQGLDLLGNMVIMNPGVPKEEVPGILAALDIAVLPGSTDIICPIKVQEFMAAELPTMVPDYPCNREVITDGVSGVLFPPKDAEALALRMAEIAADESLRKTLGANARGEAIARFSWEATWGAALQQILDRAAKRQ